MRAFICGSILCCLISGAAVLVVGCSPCTQDGSTAPLSFIVTNRFQLFQDSVSDSIAELRIVPINDDGTLSFQWWATGPDGQSADDLIAIVDARTVIFTAGTKDGPYDVHCLVTNPCGETYTAGIVLHVGRPVSLDVTTDRLGVMAGGGAQGQVTIHLNPQSGTPPFNVTWTCTGPDGQIDNDRLDVADPLKPVFTSSDLVGTYVLTANIVDARGNSSIQSVVVVVGQILGLDVIANRKSVLPGGGESGKATLLATPIGGTEPYEYSWEVIDDSGKDRSELLWDRSIRSPIFESDDSTGTFVLRCSVTDGEGTVLLGSTEIQVGQQISVDVTTDRVALPIGASSGETATLTADVIGGRSPVSLVWSATDPSGNPANDRLSTQIGANVVFTPGDDPGSYIVRCIATDSDGVTAADSVVLTVGGTLSTVVVSNRASLAPNGTPSSGMAQLKAIVYGGSAPFHYNWVVVAPSGENDQSRLNATIVENPVFVSTSTVGTYEVICTVTDSTGATAVDSITLEVGEPLSVDVRADRSELLTGGGVSGQSRLMSFATGGASPYTYSWEITEPGAGLDNTRLNDPSDANPIFTTNNTVGTYTANLIVTDVSGSVAMAAVELDVIAGVASGQTLSLDVEASQRSILPSGSSSVLNARVTGGVAPVTYAWSVTDSTGTTDNARLDTTTAATVTFTSSVKQDTYRVRCTVTDAAGNQFTDSVQISVIDDFYVVLTADAGIIKSGDTINLIADRTGGTGNFTYTWSSVDETGDPAGTFGSGAVGVGSATQTSNNDAANTWTAPAANIGTLGTYRITVIATDAEGRNYVDTVMVNVDTSLAVDVAADKVSVSPGETVELTATRTGGSGNFTYAWTCENDADIAAGTFSLGSLGAGSASHSTTGDATNTWTAPSAGADVLTTYRVSVIVTDANGLTATDTVMIVVADALTIDVIADRAIVMPGGDVDLTVSHIGGSGNITYVWSCLSESDLAAGTFANGATATGAASQSATGDVTNRWTAPSAGAGTNGTYRITVTATDDAGASFVDSTRVTVGASLSLDLTANHAMIDPGNNVTLTANQTGGEAPFDYIWRAENSAGGAAGTFTTGAAGAGNATQANEADDVTNQWSIASEGNYVITCTVTDNTGQAFTDSTEIIVLSSIPDSAFTLNVSADQLIVLPGTVVNLSGDQTGGTTTFTYAWSAMDESNAAAGTFAAANQFGVADDTTNTWTAPTGSSAAGTYRIFCTVTDSSSRLVTDSIFIQVTDSATQNVFLAPVAAAVDNVLTSTNLTAATLGAAPGQSINAASLTNPDYPRNVVVTINDKLVTSITQGTVRITGIDAQARTVTETLSFGPGAAVGTHVLTGSVPFAALTLVECYSFTNVASIPQADTIEIGMGNKFGLTGPLSAASDVLYVSEAGEIITAGYTVDTTAGQQSIEFATAPDGTRNYTVVFVPQ